MHAALIHLKRACKRFRYQDEPGWTETVPRQVLEASACMELMCPPVRTRSVMDVADLYERCPVTV
jgi:hypothetical protein